MSQERTQNNTLLRSPTVFGPLFGRDDRVRALVTLPAPRTVLIITQGSKEPFDGPQHNYSKPQNAPTEPPTEPSEGPYYFSNFERTVHPLHRRWCR